MYRLAELLRRAVSLIAPNRCPFCDVIIGSGEYLHEECYNKLSLIRERLVPPQGLSELYACCDYTGAARDAVLRFKEGHYIYAAEAFALLMTENLGEVSRGADIITSVPSSFKRRLKMGYTPAEKIAELISARCGTPYVRTMRTADNKSEQKSLSAEQRLENARNGFELIDRSLIAEKNILLIDDVCTTGSTMSACAELLKSGGAGDVKGAVFAKTVYIK